MGSKVNRSNGKDFSINRKDDELRFSYNYFSDGDDEYEDESCEEDNDDDGYDKDNMFPVKSRENRGNGRTLYGVLKKRYMKVLFVCFKFPKNLATLRRSQ